MCVRAKRGDCGAPGPSSKYRCGEGEGAVAAYGLGLVVGGWCGLHEFAESLRWVAIATKAPGAASGHAAP